MEVIVISHPEMLDGESTLVNTLFAEGLEIFHLRQPGVAIEAIHGFLKQIKPIYRQRIALHQYHELANEFAMKRLHFSERYRRVLNRNEFCMLGEYGYTLSTSLHDLEDIEEIRLFDYTFFGPLFKSISKPDYYNEFICSDTLSNNNKQFNLIALGGIKDDSFKYLRSLGFKGAALLGFIWQKPEEAVLQFKKIKELWK